MASPCPTCGAPTSPMSGKLDLTIPAAEPQTIAFYPPLRALPLRHSGVLSCSAASPTPALRTVRPRRHFKTSQLASLLPDFSFSSSSSSSSFLGRCQRTTPVAFIDALLRCSRCLLYSTTYFVRVLIYHLDRLCFYHILQRACRVKTRLATSHDP
ncbi:hypothetical protein FB45DRAFT_375747 [Roridomyces roridus]|uniref:Uncharacterized protein n=1 Tax=Roridomyces roridus TaxID=1738132 RepID=A0AAD7B3U3_9AGAR|nr:hypothetical protein FB45DRAFT_375747 [Roridomyces roridus]